MQQRKVQRCVQRKAEDAGGLTPAKDDNAAMGTPPCLNCCIIFGDCSEGVKQMVYKLGARIAKLRKAQGLTQKDLAERIHVSASTISGYELGTQVPPFDVSIRLAKTLDVSLDELAGLTKPAAISIESLAPAQANLLRGLRVEFLAPTNQSPNLSAKQLELLHQLIAIFTSKG